MMREPLCVLQGLECNGRESQHIPQVPASSYHSLMWWRVSVFYAKEQPTQETCLQMFHRVSVAVIYSGRHGCSS